MSADFSPAWFLPGPHFQTIWGRLVRPRRLVKLRREAIELPDGDELLLDHLERSSFARSSFARSSSARSSSVPRSSSEFLGGTTPVTTRNPEQPEEPRNFRGGTTPATPRNPEEPEEPRNFRAGTTPATPRNPEEPEEPRTSDQLHFILLHGLEGSSQSVYMQGLLAAIARHGYSATAMNFRSCARDPKSVLRMLPNRRQRFYHSGDTADFDFVVQTLAARMPDVKLAAIGASLGGNVLLKWLGEHPGQTLVSAAATLSVPYDLGAGARHLETTAAGRFYVKSFLKTLKKKVSRPDIASLVDVARVLRSRTFTEFDDAATAPLHGFEGAENYYRRSSSLHYLDRITTPTLALNAEDDPFVPHESLIRARAAASPAIDFRTTTTGGHVGFIGGSAPWRCEYWAEELVVHWLIERAAR